MIITIKLEKKDFDAMHDVIYDVTGIEPTNEQIQGIWDILPDDIKGAALQWGCNDSVFRDNMYVWLRKNNKKKTYNRYFINSSSFFEFFEEFIVLFVIQRLLICDIILGSILFKNPYLTEIL